MLVLIHEYTAPSFFLSRLKHGTSRHKCAQIRVFFIFVHIPHDLDVDHTSWDPFDRVPDHPEPVGLRKKGIVHPTR